VGVVSTRHPLDVEAPMASLRDVAGLTRTAMARARGVKAPTVDDSEDVGSGVRVGTLAGACVALGGHLELHFVAGIKEEAGQPPEDDREP
jgi:hypothetical protein